VIPADHFGDGLRRLAVLSESFDIRAYQGQETKWVRTEWVVNSPFTYKGRKKGRVRGELLNGLVERRSYVEKLGEARLTREFVRQQVLDAGTKDERLLDAFVAVMAWGFKPGSYGPYRTSVMLSPVAGAEGAGVVLRRVVKALGEHGPIEGYLEMANKLEQCGPAFATKFLYFASPDGKRAPILDDVAARWMERHGIRHGSGNSITSRGWNSANYGRYLQFVRAAQEALGEFDAGVVEYMMFVDQLYFEYVRAGVYLPGWIAETYRDR
jgi:hypothetical protein